MFITWCILFKTKILHCSAVAPITGPDKTHMTMQELLPLDRLTCAQKLLFTKSLISFSATGRQMSNFHICKFSSNIVVLQRKNESAVNASKHYCIHQQKQACRIEAVRLINSTSIWIGLSIKHLVLSVSVLSAHPQALSIFHQTLESKTGEPEMTGN